ncbi:MAG: SusE domain-containing protein [Chitinophagaceae bacterium]|nr:SusE domain-containing protein [Chitinophagaceae bacterium]
MKRIHKYLSLAVMAAGVFTSCEKADDLSVYSEATAAVLSTPTATIAPPPADSNKVSMILNWTDPKHATDPKTVKYVIEIDSTTRNFTRAYTRTVIGKLTDSIIAKDLNAVMLAWGFEFNKAYDLDVRVTSSYGNNNEQKRSNVLKIRATPYKIPPKVALPASGRVFIVGGATVGGWNNPVPVPAQELARIDETTFGGVFQLNGGQGYIFLPVNGSWDSKYTTLNTGAGGDIEGGFEFRTSGGSDFVSPSTSGLYKVTLDFQQGRYKLEAITIVNGLPNDLYIVGGATPGGWNNPVPTPSQQLTRRNSSQWDVTLNFTTGQAYLLLPVNGSWSQKYGAENATAPNAGLGGKIKGEGADIPAPPTSGSYKFTVDFYKGEYKLTQ